MWTNDFILTGLSNQVTPKKYWRLDLMRMSWRMSFRISQTFMIVLSRDERELKEWTEWIISDNKRKDIVKAELEGYFYWHGKPWWEIPGDDDIPWYTEEGMPEHHRKLY